MPSTSRLLVITPLVFAVAGANPLRAQSDRTQIDTTFAFNKTGSVTLSLIVGEIRVTAWARNEIHIVATSELGPITASFSPNRVRLEMRQRARRETGRVRYEVSVPVGATVSASTVAGSINVSGTRAPLSLTSVSGSITASDGKGRCEAETAAGAITLQRFDGTTRVSALTGMVVASEITGDLEIEEISGSTRIERADLTSLRFEAVAGSFDFSGTLTPNGRHHIETNAGPVTLRFPANFGATVELETFSGHVQSTDFPLTLQPAGGSDRGRNSDRQQYTINGGGAQVSIQTFNGSVTLRKIGASEKR